MANEFKIKHGFVSTGNGTVEGEIRITGAAYADNGSRIATRAWATQFLADNNYLVSNDLPTNVSAFTNDAGYLTSYTETDTLNTVTSRGSTTNGRINLGSATSGAGLWFDRSSAGSYWFIGLNGTDGTSLRWYQSGDKMSLSNTGNLAVTGTISANGGNSTQWNSAYAWGDHAGLYADASHTHAYNNLTGIPNTFTPSAHMHPIDEVDGLQAELDSKQPVGNYLTSYTETDTLDSVTGRGNTTTNSITVADIVANRGYFGSTGSNPQINIFTENATASIADTFTDTTTDKSYIYFNAGTNSNDPGYIMHETSENASPDERNEGVLHLVPSDDNTGTDYVSIHGTNDPDAVRIYTSGLIQTSSSYQLSIQSGSGSVRILDDLSVQNTLYTDSHGNSSQWNTAYGWGNHASAGYLTSVPSTFSATQITLGSGVVLRESSDRSDLLSISSSTSSWGGLQVTNSSNEALGSFMVNDSSIGLYDDQQGEWIMLYTENAGIQFFNNGSAKLTTNGSGANVVGRLYATDGIQVDYSTGGHEPMIVLNGATNYGLFHTEAANDEFTFDFNGTQMYKFRQDGVFTLNGNTITTGKISNWDTAYSWGNHASAGYLTSVPSEYLTQTEGDARYDSLGSAGAVNDRIDNDVIPNIPTNNNQLTNGAGYITDGNTGWNNTYGFITASDSITGNAATATKLATVRNIALSGAVTGNANFDGSGNITIATTATSDPTLTLAGDASGSATFTNLGNATLTVTIADDSHNHIISNIDGLQTALDGKLSTGHDMTLTLSGDASGSATFTNMGNATLSVTVANDSHTHDGRYYTESESDARFVNVTGDTITGDLLISGASLGVTSTAQGTEAFYVDGVNGRLFTISDDLSDSLFSVNTISGLPVIEAFADNTVKIGPFSNPVTIDSSGVLAIGGVTAATQTYVDNAITGLIGGAPGALDTLNELAAAINDDASYASSVTTALGLKAPLASPALTGNPTAPTQAASNNSTRIATTAFVKAQGYVTTDTNYYLNGISRSGNVLTFSVNGATNQTYTFGSAAWAATGDFAAASHNHSAANITSGTLDAARLSGTYSINVSGTSTYANNLYRDDNRTIAPSEDTSGTLSFGFTSFQNDNSAPFADYLHLRSYTDSSGGRDNLLMFSKSDMEIRLWQQDFNSADNYADFRDIAFKDELQVPAIKSNGSTPSLNTGITAGEIRTLIGAGTSSFDGAYSSLSGLPTLGTAAASAATDFVAVSGDTMTGNLIMQSADPTVKFSIYGGENNSGIVWEDGDAGDPSAQAAAIKWSASDNIMRFYNNDEGAERMRIATDGTVTFANSVVVSGGLSGFTNSAGISGNNFNITGVNQLEIADPGEGIIWKAGSNGNIILAVTDDASDNILNLSGTGASLAVNGATVATQAWVNAQGFTTSTGSNYYLSGASFSTSTGVLTLTVTGASNVTVDLDGRFALGTDLAGVNDRIDNEVLPIIQTPAITSNGSTPSLNSGITAGEIRSLIGAQAAGSYLTSYTESDTLETVTGRGNTTAGDINVKGDILLTGGATTTNQARTIDFTGFDKEGNTDYSDRAYIKHTTGTGGHSGSVLVISSMNDANDGIAFLTNASSKLKHNSNNIATENWVTAQSYLTTSGKAADADLFDGYDSTKYFRARGTIGENPTVPGSTDGWPMNPNGGTYTTVYSGHGGTVLMSNDVGGSAGSVGIEATYYGDMYVHSNVDSNQWQTKRIWTEYNFNPADKLGVNAKAADSNLLDGLDLHTGRNNQANKVVRTDGNGYLQAGWINTTSGTAGTINKIYCSQDDYVRYLTPANFRAQVTDGVYQPAGSYLTTTGKAADSNLLDGLDSSAFLRSDANDTATGAITFSGTVNLNAAVNFNGVNGQNFTVNTDSQRIIWDYQRNGTRRMSFYHETNQDTFNFSFQSGSNLQINGNRILTTNDSSSFASASHNHDTLYDSLGSADAVGTALNERIDTEVFNAIATVDGNIPTNNNQLTNGAGYITDGNTGWNNTYGFITASSTDTLTNKSGNISQWTNDSGYLTSIPTTLSGNRTIGGDLTVNGNQVITAGSNADVKFSVWSGTTYGIGMTSGVTYGGLNDYAMTFCMNNDTDRGFWWGYSGQSKSAGAMSLTTAGVLTVASSITAGGDITAFSDIRVKENIKDLEGSLDKVTQLRGVSYNKIGSEEKSIGVIAQEIQEVLPEVVREGQDGMLSVAYGNITAVLIEAVKELTAKVESLEEQLKNK